MSLKMSCIFLRDELDCKMHCGLKETLKHLNKSVAPQFQLIKFCMKRAYRKGHINVVVICYYAHNKLFDWFPEWIHH